MEENKSYLEIVLNKQTLYEALEPFLFPKMREVFQKPLITRVPPKMNIVNCGVVIIGIPHRENMRMVANQINHLSKHNLIVDTACIATPNCRELPRDGKRRVFIIEMTFVSVQEPQEINKSERGYEFAIVENDKPMLVWTNPYSSEEDGPAITDETLQNEVVNNTRKKLEDYIKDPKVIEEARTVATEIDEALKGNNWFTIDQCFKKTKWKDINEVFQILQILVFTGFAVRKAFDKGVVKYKLTLSPEDRIAFINEQIQIHKDAIALLEKDIEREQAKISPAPES